MSTSSENTSSNCIPSDYIPSEELTPEIVFGEKKADKEWDEDLIDIIPFEYFLEKKIVLMGIADIDGRRCIVISLDENERKTTLTKDDLHECLIGIPLRFNFSVHFEPAVQSGTEICKNSFTVGLVVKQSQILSQSSSSVSNDVSSQDTKAEFAILTSLHLSKEKETGFQCYFLNKENKLIKFSIHSNVFTEVVDAALLHVKSPQKDTVKVLDVYSKGQSHVKFDSFWKKGEAYKEATFGCSSGPIELNLHCPSAKAPMMFSGKTIQTSKQIIFNDNLKKITRGDSGAAVYIGSKVLGIVRGIRKNKQMNQVVVTPIWHIQKALGFDLYRPPTPTRN